MKTILLIVFSLTTFICTAQQPIFSSTIESGYEDRTILMYGAKADAINYLEKSYFSDINIKGTYKFITLDTDIRTYFRPLNPINYDPLQTEFKTGLSINYKRFTIRYEHFCSHSIEKFQFSDAYDRISIKYKLF